MCLGLVWNSAKGIRKELGNKVADLGVSLVGRMGSIVGYTKLSEKFRLWKVNSA